MKKIIIGLSLFCFVLLIGCKKYLTINPKSSFDEAYVFGSVGSATSAVMSVYGHLTGDNGYGFYLSLAYQVDSDDDIGSSNSSPGGGDNATKAFARYNAAPGNAILLGPFNQLYAGIESANICIKNIPLMNAYTNGSASEKLALQRLHGEALTLRAQMYFELIRNWGDIPAPFVPSSDQTNLYLPKTDRDIIYDKLLDDLLLAESLVPWRGENGAGTDERITKGAVKAVRAKLALFRGGYSLRNASGIMERRADYLKYYQIAKTEASQIIQSGKHALNPSFQALFKDNMDAHKIDPSGEVLFEIAMAGGASTSDSRISAFDGPNVGAQVGGGQVKPLPTYLYAFSQLDTRMSVTIADYSVNTSGNYIGAFLSTLASGKFRRDWITPAVPL
ncbi:MAG: RagB/SusD domain protein, partial [Chitinophagaceae bacterium]|nr:RagB/SusD domain protein [Chitinophagaceae bacterium]